MKFPTPAQYQEALQFPETALLDPELKEGKLKLNSLGLPMPITGAFASVFQCTTRNQTCAVKCFITSVANQKKHYQTIQHVMENIPLPYWIRFDYQDQGINVEGQVYPLLKMDWVEGIPLNRFIEQHIHQPSILEQLASAWTVLIRTLEQEKIAHGDLQHGNILVIKKADHDPPEFRLVDYDALYVPGKKQKSSQELGHRNYQHPDRIPGLYGPHMDRFSSMVIYTGLRACMANPDLWEKYNNGENILFKAADFFDPEASALFAELDKIAGLNPVVSVLKKMCLITPDQLPRLDDVLGGKPLSIPASQARKKKLRQRQNWIPAMIRLALLLTILILILLTRNTLIITGAVTAMILLLGWRWMYVYRNNPVVQRRKRLVKDLRIVSGMIREINRRKSLLDNELIALLKSQKQQEEKRLIDLKEEALKAHLKYHFIGELNDFEGVGHKAVVRLKSVGIRNAYQASYERLKDLRGLGDQSKAQIQIWRAALIQHYKIQIPDQLSDGEKRRIERSVSFQSKRIQGDINRLAAQVDVQEGERNRIQDELDRLPKRMNWTLLAWR